MTLVQPPIFVGVLAFVAVATLTAVMRRVAVWRRLVADPRPGRIHTSATPYLGGVAIVIGTIGAVAALAYPHTPQVLAVIIAALAVSVLGLIDDLWTLSPAIRLIVECAAAAGLVATGVHVDAFAGTPVVGPWIDDVGTVVWIVVITNSFNLLDNTDGVAAAVAFVTSPVLAVLAFRVGQADLAVLLIALCAGCAGFLVHNWTPARIFMGDAGSLFIGFVISAGAVLTCASDSTEHVPIAVIASALLLMTFVAVVDTCTVMVSRLRTGRRWSEGGTDHIAHRLGLMGLSTSHTAIALALATAVSAIMGLMVVSGAVPAEGSLAATLLAAAILIALSQAVDVYPRTDKDGRNGQREVRRPTVPVGHGRIDPVVGERAVHSIGPVS